jgi:hypothetical protein
MITGMDRDEILEGQAAELLEEIRLMREELREGTLTVPGSKGQPTPNRLLGELRAHTWLLVRIIGGAAAADAAAPVEDAVDRLRADWENSDD